MLARSAPCGARSAPCRVAGAGGAGADGRYPCKLAFIAACPAPPSARRHLRAALLAAGGHGKFICSPRRPAL